MTTSAHLDAQMIRCSACGSLLFNKRSACNTCQALLTREDGRDWTDAALCRQVDPELWFPETESAPRKHVLETCSMCPVRRNCLRAGLHETYGIWAGYSSQQRAELRSRVAGLKPEARNAIVEQAADRGASFLGGRETLEKRK